MKMGRKKYFHEEHNRNKQTYRQTDKKASRQLILTICFQTDI